MAGRPSCGSHGGVPTGSSVLSLSPLPLLTNNSLFTMCSLKLKLMQAEMGGDSDDDDGSDDGGSDSD